jgi:hypothetical protein
MSLVRQMLKFAAGIFLLGLACSLGGASAPATPSATSTDVLTPTITLTPSAVFTDVPGTNVGGTAAVAAPTLFIPAAVTHPPTAAPIPTNTPVPLPVINPAGSPPTGQCSVVLTAGNKFVNIRSGPGTTYPAIAILQSYAPVVGLSSGWYQISLPNGVGWVSGSVVMGAGTCAPTPAAPNCTITITANATAYAQPTFSSPMFATFPAGTTLQASARTADGWYGFDPGIAQAGNTGLALLRWLPAAVPVIGTMTRSAGCDSVPIVVALPPTAVPPSGPCVLTMTINTVAYSQPNFSNVFATLSPGESFEATARTIDGWYGFDPGIAQAGNSGLARLRWVPAGSPAGNTITQTIQCGYLPTVTYP